MVAILINLLKFMQGSQISLSTMNSRKTATPCLYFDPL